MSISINPVLPVTATPSATPELVLHPGTVVDAQVLKLLSDNLVRIAIDGLSIDVLSQVPLSAGQTLQLAVSQANDGVIRLALAGQGAGTSSDTVALSSEALIDAAAHPLAGAAASGNQLTPLERQAVSAATKTAAAQQDGLSQLFANLDAVAGSKGLPAKLQQAVLQVLSQQTSLDQNLTAGDVKTAFQKSGLFLEASLASGSVVPGAGVPDLKAALIVLRQTLLSSLAVPAGSAAPVTSAPITPAALTSTLVQSLPQVAEPSTLPQTAATPAPAPPLAPDAPEIPLPQAGLAAALDSLAADSAGRIVLSAPAQDLRSTTGAALNLLQQAVQEIPRQLGDALLSAGTPRDLRNDSVAAPPNAPPPPFRGAQPSAQPVASSSIASDAPLGTSVHHLLADTDAAIARQTLLQVASLPDRAESVAARLDPAVPRWHFEIPFATPQGTAMAQFEISRDGGGSEVEAAERVWRARFSLDVEPAGPVHALISLSGERTSVRMWAERPATAAQLRAGTAQLSQALSKADLHPGDIVIGDGMPPVAAPAPAGHFLDRAL
jgi:flagellar hook-length control protein FliK